MTCGECGQPIRPRDTTVACAGAEPGYQCEAKIHLECVDTLKKRLLCSYCRWALAHPGAR
jgi:hypothetical protein